jgi:dolichol-phosphate mannosyltransferase
MHPTLIVMPTYNERENLPRMVQQLLQLPAKVDLLVVDDNSPDGTGKLADELAAKHPEIHVLHRAVKNGLGRAYLAGFQWALERNYEFVFEMDGDFSHNPNDVPVLLDAAKDADLVLGSRYINGIRIINWPLGRLMLSKSAAAYVQIITGMPITDPTGGYKCFRRRALEALDLAAVQSNGYSFQIELTHKLWRQGYRRSPDHLHRTGPRTLENGGAHCKRGALDGVAAVVSERLPSPSPQRVAAKFWSGITLSGNPG